METWNLLQNIWFFLIGVLFLGYSILDGFDLGVGSLFPLLAKKKEEKDALYQTIGPFWDGNEVWLLTGGGALFAAFPHTYATVFSGFYLPLMLVLFALIFRAVSLEFRSHDLKRQKTWDRAFTAGSLVPSLLFGVALGNLIQGIPLNSNKDFTGDFFTLLRPFPLVIGAFGLIAILMMGSTYAVLKAEGTVQERSRGISHKLWWIFWLFFGLSFILSLTVLPGMIRKTGAWISTGVIVIGLLFMKWALGGKKDGLAFFSSSLVFAGLWGIAGSILYPNLVKAGNDPALSLDIYNSSSSELTLKVMLIIALVGMPLVIGYTIYLYRVFKGKARPADGGY
jgi:cytochrome d ubiquinol oxidase subunit II